MKLKFTKHIAQRKTQRRDYMNPTNRYRETIDNFPKTESTLRRKGVWYARFCPKDLLVKTYCIVNNLEVYCGIVIDNDEDPHVLITTYYPYSKKMKRRLFPRGMENFECFDINDDIENMQLLMFV